MKVPTQLARTFDFASQRIAYDIVGDGPPLVLVHGTPFSAHAWHRIVPELARNYRIHLYDLLGYGQSEMRDSQVVSLGIQNKVLAALLKHWGLERPFVICHDFGAATVLRAHLLDDCDFARMLIFDAVALRPWGSPFVQHVREHEAAFAGTPPYIHRAILAAYISGAVRRRLAEAELEPYLAPWIGEPGQGAFYRQIAQMDQLYTDEVEPLYAKIRCPVSLLWGTEDEWIPIAQGRKLAGLIPDCRFTEIAGAGHLMQEDAPEAIVAEATRFFSAP
jgi:pimeloyl-ACP methyl ester carboxylesterase